MLSQEEGCTIEDLLLEEDRLVSLCRGSSMPKLIEFVCQRPTLQKLIQYAVQYPKNQNNHDQTHKFPFFAADVLASNAVILKALIEGGWQNEKEETEEEGREKSEEDAWSQPGPNSLVNSIMKNNDEQQKVLSALSS